LREDRTEPDGAASKQAAPPRYIATIGLHASASTWVFNVVRELMACAVGAERVLATYADEPHEIPGEAELAGRHLVLKLHGSPGAEAWLESLSPMTILSIRDPRDAAISMAQRFKAPLNHTVQWLLRDCKRLIKLTARAHRLLRYEDRFFENPQTLAQLSAAVTPTVDQIAMSAVFERYRVESVRQFAAQLASLPSGRLLVTHSVMMDRVTQIHRCHVGDSRSGKWRALSPATRQELTRIFEPFLRHFGYELDP
jgi:hypothetical protein